MFEHVNESSELSKKVAIVSDEFKNNNFHTDILNNALMEAGFVPSHCHYIKNSPTILDDLERIPNLHGILALGEQSLKSLTYHTQLEKHYLSVYNVKPDKEYIVIPMFHQDRIQKEFKLHVFLKMACLKLKKEILNGKYNRKSHAAKTRTYHINPNINTTLEYLNDVVARKSLIAVDIENSTHQINTVGFAISPNEAIAIRTLPGDFGPENFYKLFTIINSIISNPRIKKIYQNCAHEAQYFAHYGIETHGIYWDTMWAQRMLWPEFKVGLDMVGRIYTNKPYWKDDNKNWNNIQDWASHLEYNCDDTTGTFEGQINQYNDMKDKGLLDLFENTIMRYAPMLTEMCINGLPQDPLAHQELTKEITDKLNLLTDQIKQIAGPNFNPRSPKQKVDYFRAKGLQLYKERDAATNSWCESVSSTCLKKMRVKYPDEQLISHLISYSTLAKLKSSYLDADTNKYTNSYHYSLSGAGTETLRWASHKDIFDCGFNAQTIPGGTKGVNFKKVIRAPKDTHFIQVDLKQAESRFVAYDACEETLLHLLETGQDIHKRVACEIYKKPESEITKLERQLGKKSGHGANYSMKESTFIDQCLTDMDLVITVPQAHQILEAYHRVFPKIRTWQQRIKNEVYKNRRLDTPFGYYKYFFDRLSDDTFREAYAFRPQSTIPFITNKLMIYLATLRPRLTFKFHLQCHDSLLMSADSTTIDHIANECLDLDKWHPDITLTAGKLKIPTDVEIGEHYGRLEPWTSKSMTSVQ